MRLFRRKLESIGLSKNRSPAFAGMTSKTQQPNHMILHYLYGILSDYDGVPLRGNNYDYDANDARMYHAAHNLLPPDQDVLRVCKLTR